ncbi:MAG: substrate-binding domain-containing protein [Anaerolineae bacterium]|nr:substrate-binding domain-containing protein [Anaerolineae bacterium]
MLLLLGCLLGLLACSPPPRPPQTVRIRLAAAPPLARLAHQLALTAQGHDPNLEVEIVELSAEEVVEALATGRADLALRQGGLDHADRLSAVDGRPSLRAWPLATDAIALIVHPSNRVGDLSMEQLRRVFSGLEHRWDQVGGTGARIRLVAREPEALARLTFDGAILAGTHVAGSAIIMPGDEAVAQFVAGHPEALGYVSMALAGSRVKAISLDGVPPTPEMVAAGRYPLTLPITLLTRTGAPQKVRSFVSFCLGPEGQEVVGQLYGPPPGR